MDARTVSELATAPQVRAYLEGFDSSPADHLPAEQLRFVVLDTETTGLDLRRDRIITIGAVAVNQGQIDLSDVFEALLRIEHNQSSVTVHGITRDEARAGMDEPQALLDFLDYLGNSVIVGHHIGFDIDMLDEACSVTSGSHCATAASTRWVSPCGWRSGARSMTTNRFRATRWMPSAFGSAYCHETAIRLPATPS